MLIILNLGKVVKLDIDGGDSRGLIDYTTYRVSPFCCDFSLYGKTFKYLSAPVFEKPMTCSMVYLPKLISLNKLIQFLRGFITKMEIESL